MVNPIVAFDESGNTGQDLLNSAQPIFSLVSVYLSGIETEEAIKILAARADQELKFSSMIKSAAGRRRVLLFMQSSYVKPYKVKVSIIHKSYMVVGKVVDLLIEPLAHRDGINLYQQGGNIALTNLYYTCLPTVCGEDEFQDFQRTFVGMIRNKDENSIKRFYKSCQRMYHCCRLPKFKPLLATIYASIDIIDEILLASDATQLDPAVTCFIDHCDKWGSHLGCEFDVIYDESKPIKQKQELLSLLMIKDEPEVKVGYDYRKMVLPLKATGLNFGDSKKVKLLQVADIISGASAYWARGFIQTNIDRNFCRCMEEYGIRSLVFNCLWPSADVTPKQLGTEEVGGIDLTDYMVDFIDRQERKRDF